MAIARELAARRRRTGRTVDPASPDADRRHRRPSRRGGDRGDPRGARPDEAVPAGQARVEALRGVSLAVSRRVRRAHGPVGLRQVDAPAGPRRARPADERRGHPRGPDDQPAVGRPGDAPAPRPTGFVFQSFNLIPLLDGPRERGPAVHDRRRGPDTWRARAIASATSSPRRPDRQGAPQARPAVGR